jgi:hypothetical protein
MRVKDVSVIKMSGPTESRVRSRRISTAVDISVPFSPEVRSGRVEGFMSPPIP